MVWKGLLFAAVLFVSAIPAARAQGGYEDAIRRECAVKGCNADHVIATMYCESGGDPYAVNPVTGDYGLMQINLSIWGPITDPYAQIDFATTKFAQGQSYLWTCA